MDQQIKEFALNYKLNNAVGAPVEVPAHQQNGGIEAYVLNAWKEFSKYSISLALTNSPNQTTQLYLPFTATSLQIH